ISPDTQLIYTLTVSVPTEEPGAAEPVVKDFNITNFDREILGQKIVENFVGRCLNVPAEPFNIRLSLREGSGIKM
ncbi:MAG: hypothetical protein AAGJ50_14085, partial [Pseudomonadota bacterium]